ncbi:hypothetical protein B0H14DRAFT_2618270 [Mycena olivaceomarginata]|nr:hypothetical protein B0H14DRAFT_2618270 [Mycena olivaceomarginata]
MSTTYRKDRAVVFGIWRAPPSLLNEASEAKMITLVPSGLCSPCRLPRKTTSNSRSYVLNISSSSSDRHRHYIVLKILQTKHVNEHLQVLGLPEAPPSVWLVAERECATTSIFMLPRRPMPIDTLKVNVSVRDGPTVLELNNDGGWQRTTREMKAKSKSIECERWYRFYSRKDSDDATFQKSSWMQIKICVGTIQSPTGFWCTYRRGSTPPLQKIEPA